MNKVILIGNLTRAPELRTTNSGKSVCNFNIAVNRRMKDKNGDAVTDFFPIIVWDNLADNCVKYLDKGKKVCVVGELQNRSYEKDGAKRTVTEIIAESVEFLSPREKQQSVDPMAGFTDIDDGDLPF